MKIKSILCAAGITLFCQPLFAGDVELAEMMGKMQYFTHKATLSIQEKNQPLADFYLHELEEMIEAVEEVKSYDGHPIGQLTKSMLVPSFEALEKQVKAGKMKVADEAIQRMIFSCNACHQATAHGFIKIKLNRENTYMQDFKKG